MIGQGGRSHARAGTERRNRPKLGVIDMISTFSAALTLMSLLNCSAFHQITSRAIDRVLVFGRLASASCGACRACLATATIAPKADPVQCDCARKAVADST